MTENQRLLLRAIVLDPKDDTVRGAYADCIEEENGEVERAEFIRVQIDIAKSPEPALLCMKQLPGLENKKNQKGGTCTVCKANEECRYHTLRRREWELWDQCIWGWHEAFVGIADGIRLKCHTRGFISHITCTAEDWLKYADQLVWNEGMSDKCICINSGYNPSEPYECMQCNGTGRVPRSMPETAQPIEKVVLTTRLEIEHQHGFYRIRDEAYVYSHDEIQKEMRSDREDIRLAISRLRWPGIEFEIQNTGNVDDGLPDEDDSLQFSHP